MRQAIAAPDRAEMIKRVVERYKSLVLLDNAQKIQVNGSGTDLSLSVILMFMQAPLAGNVRDEAAGERRLAAINRLVDQHRADIIAARSIQIDFGFGAGEVTYEASQTQRVKGRSAV